MDMSTPVHPVAPPLILTSSRNQIQMVPVRLNISLLHSVHLRFKLCNEAECCVEANCSDAQEPSEFDFQHWLGFARRENNEENFGKIEVTTLILKLQTRCFV